MSDIFVSYRHARKTLARQLVSALSARGWDVWWDWNIPVGNDWKGELDAELDAMLRGLADFAPKPWPVRFREIQARGGTIEVTKVRVQQGDVVAVGAGTP